jgi:hypothetical protein
MTAIFHTLRGGYDSTSTTLRRCLSCLGVVLAYHR